MTLVPFSIEGIHLILHDTHEDERGEFTELFNSTDLNSRDIPFNVSQVNYVKSRKGTLRGLHFQISPFPQAKIIRCLSGAIVDILVDVRPKSPTFKQWMSFLLSPEYSQSMYVPPGIAHGYYAYEDSEVQYLVSGLRIHELERVLKYDDPEIGISLNGHIPAILSEKDKNGALLKDLLHEL